jgi:oligogalacturonide transport system permease protein
VKRFFLRHKTKLIGLVFVSPWIIGFLVFTVYPVAETLRYSFSNVRFFLKGITLEHVGFDNYVKVLFQDANFKLALPGYIIQLIGFVPMILVFSILLALLLNTKIRFRKFFRAVFFLPVIIVSGPVINNLRSMDAAAIKGLGQFHVYGFIAEYFPRLISTPILYIFDNAVLIMWFCGVQILVFLSGLQKVDRNIYEASMVDGASTWQQFWKLTIPTLTPFFLLNAIYTTVDISMSTMNPVITLIKQGLFQTNLGFGFSAAATWIYFFIILITVFIAFLLFGRGEDLNDFKQKKGKLKSKNVLKVGGME